MLGSTEFVEKHSHVLMQQAIAYINTDVAISYVHIVMVLDLLAMFICSRVVLLSVQLYNCRGSPWLEMVGVPSLNELASDVARSIAAPPTYKVSIRVHDIIHVHHSC